MQKQYIALAIIYAKLLFSKPNCSVLRGSANLQEIVWICYWWCYTLYLLACESLDQTVWRSRRRAQRRPDAGRERGSAREWQRQPLPSPTPPRGSSGAWASVAGAGRAWPVAWVRRRWPPPVPAAETACAAAAHRPTTMTLPSMRARIMRRTHHRRSALTPSRSFMSGCTVFCLHFCILNRFSTCLCDKRIP